MSLVIELCKIPGAKYVPKPEISCCHCPENDEGIWDTLGFYKEQNERITICDKEIEEYVKNVPEEDLEKIRLLRNELILFVRELVRLHEHGHAFLHTAEVGKKWQYNLPSEVNEPVTEFIVHFIIEKMDRDDMIEVFDELDKNSPGCYKNWSKIKDVLNDPNNPTIQALKDNPRFIALLTGFVRSKKWKNWDEFFNSLKEYLDPKNVGLWIKELKRTINKIVVSTSKEKGYQINSAKKYGIYWFYNVEWYLEYILHKMPELKEQKYKEIEELKPLVSILLKEKVENLDLDEFEKDEVKRVIVFFRLKEYFVYVV